jgi:hypothetical protein
MEETNVTALNQKLFFSDVLCLEVPLYHHPTALQECEARMLVCSVGLMPARRNDHNHLHTVAIQLCTTHFLSLTMNLNNSSNNNINNNNNTTAVGLSEYIKQGKEKLTR